MEFKRTTAINKLLKLKARKKVVQGGTSAGKTFGILPILIDRAAKTPHLEISVVSETIPHLRRGAIKDFLKIMDWTGRYIDANWNKTLLTYRFVNGSYIEFFSAEQESKLRGARRNVLYINEANNIDFEAYHQLAIRTSGDIWLDFNPTNEFWAHTEVLKDSDSEHLILTYKDNEALPETIVREIESAQYKSGSYWQNWFKVYGLGQIGSLQGVVFDTWKQVDLVPPDAKLIGSGMDFGFTNDPTTLVEVYRLGDAIYLDEQLYRTNMTNNDIGNYLKTLDFGRKELICDSAEPKSIEELRRQGFNVFPAVKGADSINIGIDILKRFDIHVTKSSVNLIKELRGYTWEVDNEGKTTNKPIDTYNHCFVGETLITTINGQKRIDEINIGDKVLTTNGYKRVLHKFNNGVKQVNKYSMQLGSKVVYLIGTENHNIKTDKSWIQLSQLQQGMKLFKCKNLEARNISYIKGRDILVEGLSDCIQKFGGFIKVKYLKVIMSIMSMVISSIMKYQISILFINRYILDLKAKRGLRIILNLQNHFNHLVCYQQKNGINQKRVLSGIESKVEKHGLIDHILIRRANIVAKITKQEKLAEANFVIRIAKLKHVEKGLPYYDNVYDLMIEDCHEYFANEILVHNCIDPIRYVALLKLNNRPSGRYATINV